ncbi:MAG: ATP-binding cassette domain-containing protein [Saprospiraceae bacterium]
MIQTFGLVKSYTKDRKIIFPDFKVQNAEVLLIHGPSGCGKTSLLHILAGLITQDEGSVEFDDQKMEELSDSQRDNFRGKNIGVCLQKPIFIRSLSVLDNLLLSQKISADQIDKDYCLSLLIELNLEHTINQKTNTLSQGEQQRLMLIRALINKPKLILADEPTSSLDDTNTIKLGEILIEQSKTHHASLIVVSHDERLKRIFHNKILLS